MELETIVNPRFLKVDGVRRVWGTLSMCTSGAVSSAIRRFCSIDTIRVKRKSKEIRDGKHQWWFVLHDDEATLCTLDAKWNLIELQTEWKLELCFRSTILHSSVSTKPAVSDPPAADQLDKPLTSAGTITSDSPSSVSLDTPLTPIIQSCVQAQPGVSEVPGDTLGSDVHDDTFLPDSLPQQTQGDC